MTQTQKRELSVLLIAMLIGTLLTWLLVTPTRAASLASLSVSGNRLLSNGTPIALHGVNHSGTEYNCVKNAGIVSGPADAGPATWGATFLRIPLNEDCWLGLNGVNPAYAAANYRDTILAYVGTLHNAGIHAELSLMWAAPGSILATHQDIAPDVDHSPAAWASMAQTFAGDTADILAPFSEEHTGNAQCFYQGGCTTTDYGVSFQVAGMQQAVTTMRANGYTGVIAIPATSYANYFPPLLAYMPSDPLHNLVAEGHIYGNGGCGVTSGTGCLDSTVAPVAKVMPVLFSEIGETYNKSSCNVATNTTTITTWADAHQVGWAAWTWNTWGNCDALISNYSGTPFSVYGAYVQSRLLGYAGQSTPAPQPTSSPSPQPTSTPVPQLTSTPLPQPSPTVTPSGIPLNQTPCTVLLNGVLRLGVCTGTFQ